MVHEVTRAVSEAVLAPLPPDPVHRVSRISAESVLAPLPIAGKYRVQRLSAEVVIGASGIPPAHATSRLVAEAVIYLPPPPTFIPTYKWTPDYGWLPAFNPIATPHDITDSVFNALLGVATTGASVGDMLALQVDGSIALETPPGGSSGGGGGPVLLARDNPSLGSSTSMADNSYGPDLLSFTLAGVADLRITWQPYLDGYGDPCVGLRNDDTSTSWWFDAYNPAAGLDAFPGSVAQKGRGARSSYHVASQPIAFLKDVPAGAYTVRSYKVGTTSLTLAGHCGMVEVWSL